MHSSSTARGAGIESLETRQLLSAAPAQPFCGPQLRPGWSLVGVYLAPLPQVEQQILTSKFSFFPADEPATPIVTGDASPWLAATPSVTTFFGPSLRTADPRGPGDSTEASHHGLTHSTTDSDSAPRGLDSNDLQWAVVIALTNDTPPPALVMASQQDFRQAARDLSLMGSSLDNVVVLPLAVQLPRGAADHATASSSATGNATPTVRPTDAHQGAASAESASAAPTVVAAADRVNLFSAGLASRPVTAAKAAAPDSSSRPIRAIALLTDLPNASALIDAATLPSAAGAQVAAKVKPAAQALGAVAQTFIRTVPRMLADVAGQARSPGLSATGAAGQATPDLQADMLNGQLLPLAILRRLKVNRADRPWEVTAMFWSFVAMVSGYWYIHAAQVRRRLRPRVATRASHP